MKNLNFLWEFNPKCPWEIPTASIKDYYGEKIAFYFAFISFYTKHLLLIGLLGVIASVLQMSINSSSKSYVCISIIFGFLITFWASLLYVSWNQ